MLNGLLAAACLQTRTPYPLTPRPIGVDGFDHEGSNPPSRLRLVNNSWLTDADMWREVYKQVCTTAPQGLQKGFHQAI